MQQQTDNKHGTTTFILQMSNGFCREKEEFEESGNKTDVMNARTEY